MKTNTQAGTPLPEIVRESIELSWNYNQSLILLPTPERGEKLGSQRTARILMRLAEWFDDLFYLFKLF